MLHGEDDGAGEGGHAGLVVEVGDVGVDRGGGDEQLGRDLPLGAAPDQQPQDLDLAAGEAGKPTRLVGWWPAASRTAATAWWSRPRLGHKGPGRLGWWVGWAVGRSETRAW